MPYFKTTAEPSTDIYFEDSGGSGQPVVLIHGWPLSHRMWESQINALTAAGYRCIAYDRRGFGESGRPNGGYDYDTFASDLNDLMTALDLRGAAIAGFSMGGGEVARYMSRHGGRNVRAAGLIASIVPYMLKDETNPEGIDAAMVEEQMKQPIRDDRPAFFAKFAKFFYGVGYVTSPVSDAVLHRFELMASQGCIKGILDCIDAFCKTDLRPDLAAFNVPTLIVHGTGDQTVPIGPSARAAAAGIAGARLIEYEDAPHGLTVTHKDRLTQDMLAFLAG
jgi:pimeloyl-ACP methyl ester carboxylesterase